MIGIVKNTAQNLLLVTDNLQQTHEVLKAQNTILLGESQDGYVYLIQGRVVIVYQIEQPAAPPPPPTQEGTPG